MAFAEDMSAFFNAETPGYSQATIGAAHVDGIFSTDYADYGNGLVSGSAPVFTCATADVTSVVEGTAITISAVGYTVRGIEPDGTGVTLLRLEKS